MKHIKLFENFESEQPLYVIDLIKEFPDLYEKPEEIDPNDPDKDYHGEPKTTLFVYDASKFDGVVRGGDISTNIDPSFYDGRFKLKLVVDAQDQLHYGSTNIIYMGLDDTSIESVLAWFRSLINDPARDYLSW
jgi:hypothetical protein